MVGTFSKENSRIFSLNDYLSKITYNKQLTRILANLAKLANFMKLMKSYLSY